MFRPIRIRAGSANFCPYNTPLRFVNNTPIVFSTAVGRPFPEKPISHARVPLSDCRTDSVIRREIDEDNDLPYHLIFAQP